MAPIVAGVASAVAGAALIALGLCLLKRKRDKQTGTTRQVHPPVVAVAKGSGAPTPQRNPAAPPTSYRPAEAVPQYNSNPPPPPYQHATAALHQASAPPPPPYLQAMAGVAAASGVAGTSAADIDDGSSYVSGGSYALGTRPASAAGVAQHGAELITHTGIDEGFSSGGGRDGFSSAAGDTETSAQADGLGGASGVAQYGVGGGGSADRALIVTASTSNISTRERNSFTPAYSGSAESGAAFVPDEPKPTLDIGPYSSTDSRGSTGGPGLGRAVGEAALELARNCLIPGVSEAASAVSILVELATGNQDTKNSTEPSLRRCRSIVLMLQRATKVLGKVSPK